MTVSILSKLGAVAVAVTSLSFADLAAAHPDHGRGHGPSAHHRHDGPRYHAPRHYGRRHVAPPPRAVHRHAPRWAIGRPLPRGVHAHRYDHWSRHGLRRPPRGHYYHRVGDDILLIRLIDSAVISLAFRL